MKKISLLLCSCLITFAVNAQSFKTKSVSIFKNGQSFFIKEGKVDTDKGVWKMQEKDIPPALFGSLWFHSPEGNIQTTKSYTDSYEEKKTLDAIALTEILQANVGKRMLFHLKTVVHFTSYSRKK